MNYSFRSTLKCSVAVITLVSASAFASAAQAQAMWTGTYIGVGVGTSNNSSDVDLSEPWDDEGYDRFFKDQLDGHGGALTLYGGYSQAAMNNFVWGVEGDVSWIGATAQDILNHVDSYYDGVLRSDVDFLASLRLRGGFTAGDTLFYLTGGLAVADIQQSYTVGEKSIHFVRDTSKWGWIGGGGVEHRLMDNVSIRAEGLFSQFSGGSASDSGGYFSSSVLTDFGDTTIVVGRLGLAIHL